MAIVTYQEIEQALGIYFDEVQARKAVSFIGLVEGALRVYLGRPVEPTEVVGEVHYVTSSRRVMLHSTPVVSLQRVELDGVEIEVAPEHRARWGFELSVPQQSGYVCTVDYTAGLDAVATGIKAIALSALTRMYSVKDTGMEGMKYVQIEGRTRFDIADPNQIFSDQELRMLRRYKRPSIMTVYG
jgi:hypothetical protein